MKLVHLIIVLIGLPIYSISQSTARNMYAEIGGPGGFISATYDIRLAKANNGFGSRAGIGVILDPYNVGFTLPVAINYLVGKKTSFLELEGAVSFVHFKVKNQDSWFHFRSENFLVPAGYIGYRFQPLAKGFTFRAGLCKYFKNVNTGTILGVKYLYPALSFGYTFR